MIFESKIKRDVLIYLNNGKEDYISGIYKKLGSTFKCTSSAIKDLEKKKFIQIIKKKNKQRKYYKITNKGREIVKLILKIKNLEQEKLK